MQNDIVQGRALFSTIGHDGMVRVEVRDMAVPPPAEDEVVIRVMACAVNPSDMSMMLGPVDPDSLRVHRGDGGAVLTGSVPAERLAALAQRLGKPIAVGNEGAGTIVAAGSAVGHLLGRKCAAAPLGGMFASHRVAKAAEVVLLPDAMAPAEAAAMFVNPLTVLAMVETMRREGHSAIIHTAAASNLGRMLVRHCKAENIGLVNIVRRDEQVAQLRALGAEFVVNSSSPSFAGDLTDAVQATGATLAFDAIGGGGTADQLLRAMEEAARRNLSGFSRYGSAVHKQVYIYSDLDAAPTLLTRAYGMAWGVGAYVLTNVLAALGPDDVARMRQRVLRDLRTTFASHYAGTIGLADLLDPDRIRSIRRRATGSKYLLEPGR